MSKVIETKQRAKISILNTLLSFPTIRQKDWTSESFGSQSVECGDLISLCAAPNSKWYVSWVIDIERDKPNFFGHRYLLESIEDGSLCWWHNVGLNIYSRKKVKDHPTRRWNDRQYKLYDRWLKVGKRNDAYIVLPVLPDFHEDNSVTLDVRIRFGITDFRNPKTFDNWKKLTMKQMDEYYLQSVNLYKKL